MSAACIPFCYFIALYLVIIAQNYHMQYGCKKPAGEVKRQKTNFKLIKISFSLMFWISNTFYKAADWIFKPYFIPLFWNFQGLHLKMHMPQSCFWMQMMHFSAARHMSSKCLHNRMKILPFISSRWHIGSAEVEVLTFETFSIKKLLGYVKPNHVWDPLLFR